MRTSKRFQRVVKRVGQAVKAAIVPAAENPGLVCRQCGCQHFFTLETRRVADTIQRRRECRHCGTRRTTIEQDAPPPAPRRRRPTS